MSLVLPFMEIMVPKINGSGFKGSGIGQGAWGMG
jgi:hypothetical protein